MSNLCGIGWQVYRLLQRTVRCDRCGARAGEKCIGRRGRIESTHLARKHLVTEWRRVLPEHYRALRDEVAAELLRQSSLKP